VLLYPVDEGAQARDEPGGGEHEGYVAGRQADGYLISISADDPVNFTSLYLAYVPRCQCGWTGPTFSNTPTGFAACQRLWREKHLEPFLLARRRQPSAPSHAWTPRVIHGALAPSIASIEAVSIEAAQAPAPKESLG
jgi:hypothetical protein